MQEDKFLGDAEETGVCDLFCLREMEEELGDEVSGGLGDSR